MMWNHFLNLLGHSWDAMVRETGTTTLGFLVWTLAVTLFGWLANLAWKWVQLNRQKSDRPFRTALSDSIWPGVLTAIGLGTLILLTFEGFFVRTVYDIHQSLAETNRQLVASNSSLTAELEIRKHSISTSDPVFPNTIYMLQAFNIYRHALGGAHCQIKVTAPPESGALASMIAQFSNSVSGCNTFGPMETRTNPDVEKETRDGMDPDLLILHADRGDKAADQLFMNLGNQIQMKRSYDLPPGSLKGFIWLQFGPNTKWNSDRYVVKAISATVPLEAKINLPSEEPTTDSERHWLRENLDRVLAFIAIIIAVWAMIDVRRLFKELEFRDRNTEVSIRRAVLGELLTHTASFATFFRAAQFIDFSPHQPDKEASVAMLMAFRLQELVNPAADAKDRKELRKLTRDKIETQSAVWARLLIDNGIGTLKDGWTINDNIK